jgi:aryl-alcohol dehydrogenase-like predicted oxidoreductase
VWLVWRTSALLYNPLKARAGAHPALGRIKLQCRGHGGVVSNRRWRILRYQRGAIQSWERDIERGLLPWCEKNQLPIMAYSTLGKGGDLLPNAVLVRVAQRQQSSPAVIALAWTIRSGRFIAMPESGSSAHVREKVSAMSLRFTEPDLDELSRAFSSSAAQR